MILKVQPSVVLSDGVRFPFSRGVLTKSLTALGLPLEDAYSFACDIQKEVAGREGGECTKEELIGMVLSRLRERFGEEVAKEYSRLRQGSRQLVVESTGTSMPFSKGLLTVSIQASGVAAETAFEIARLVESGLKAERKTVVTRDEIRKRTAHFLSTTSGEEFARYYLMWRHLKDEATPVIVLIGGGTGTGKSTLAGELGRFLGFKRASSTDSIRQIMGTLFSDQFVPLIHESSYTAYKSLPKPLSASVDPVIFAFQEQAIKICVGVRAMIERAVREGVSMVIDGVHLVPGCVEIGKFGRSAIVSWIMCKVSDEATHRARFSSREAGAGNRLAQRYLENFDAIRKIQDYVISLAEKNGITTVENDDFDKAVVEAMAVVSEDVMRQCGFEAKR